MLIFIYQRLRPGKGLEFTKKNNTLTQRSQIFAALLPRRPPSPDDAPYFGCGLSGTPTAHLALAFPLQIKKNLTRDKRGIWR